MLSKNPHNSVVSLVWCIDTNDTRRSWWVDGRSAGPGTGGGVRETDTRLAGWLVVVVARQYLFGMQKNENGRSGTPAAAAGRPALRRSFSFCGHQVLNDRYYF